MLISQTKLRSSTTHQTNENFIFTSPTCDGPNLLSSFLFNKKHSEHIINGNLSGFSYPWLAMMQLDHTTLYIVVSGGQS